MSDRRSMMKRNSRQRKRPRVDRNITGHQVKVPQIPGVPSDLAPSLLQAIQASVLFFQFATKELHGPTDELERRNQAEPSVSVMDSILDRIAPTDEDEKQTERCRLMYRDRQSWIDALKRKIGDEKRSGSKRSVPMSCFDFLWKMQQHDRVTHRRASLWLSGTLLQKSAECRSFLSTEDDGGVLMAWVRSVSDAHTCSWKNPEEAAVHLSLWQQESLLLLTHLSEEFGSLYPKFNVATQYLKQQCTSFSQTGTSERERQEGSARLDDASAPDWRRTRDIAMKHGERQIAATERLIRRAHDCLDAIVPRMGVSSSTSVSLSNHGIDEDDDDDLEWEEGDERAELTCRDADESCTDHAAAVERTLAVMESSGGLQGGTLEISLSTTRTDGIEEVPGHFPNEGAREILCQTAEKLSSRHMPRLSAWVDALTKADNLWLEGQSLVTMTVKDSRYRADLLQRLLDIKRTIASVLSSTRRLGIGM